MGKFEAFVRRKMGRGERGVSNPQPLDPQSSALTS